MELIDEEIWYKAYRGDSSILSDPRVSIISGQNGDTPLHYLAWHGVKEDWFHPDFNKVKSNDGKTPRDTWINTGHKPLTCVDFINK